MPRAFDKHSPKYTVDTYWRLGKLDANSQKLGCPSARTLLTDVMSKTFLFVRYTRAAHLPPPELMRLCENDANEPNRTLRWLIIDVSGLEKSHQQWLVWTASRQTAPAADFMRDRTEWRRTSVWPSWAAVERDLSAGARLQLFTKATTWTDWMCGASVI